MKANNEVIEGAFQNNKPNGMCSVRIKNGDLYQGQMKDGCITGQGIYKSLQRKTCYEGDFIDAKRHGAGKFYSLGTAPKMTYVYEGQFEDDA